MERKRKESFKAEGKKSVHSGTTSMPLEKFLVEVRSYTWNNSMRKHHDCLDMPFSKALRNCTKTSVYTLTWVEEEGINISVFYYVIYAFSAREEEYLLCMLRDQVTLGRNIGIIPLGERFETDSLSEWGNGKLVWANFALLLGPIQKVQWFLIPHVSRSDARKYCFGPIDIYDRNLGNINRALIRLEFIVCKKIK